MYQLTKSEQYTLASKARSKLLYAARSKGRDYDLRVLVGHANLLDRITESLGNEQLKERLADKETEGSVIFCEHSNDPVAEPANQADQGIVSHDYSVIEEKASTIHVHDNDSLYYYTDLSVYDQTEDEDDYEISTTPCHYIYQSYKNSVSGNLSLLQLDVTEISDNDENDENDENDMDLLDDIVTYGHEVTRVSSTEVDPDDEDHFSEDDGLYTLRPIYV